MIGRQHGRIVIACDACGRMFEGDSDEWIDVWPQARRKGWRVRKIGKDWYQFCGSGAECERRRPGTHHCRTMLAGQSIRFSSCRPTDRRPRLSGEKA